MNMITLITAVLGIWMLFFDGLSILLGGAA